MRASVMVVVFGLLAGRVWAQNPPLAPVIIEPSRDGEVLNPGDVHMATDPMADPDPGDTHACSDFEIWTVAGAERVWLTSCIGGIERVHSHLGDGTFLGSYTGRRELKPDVEYRLRIRHRDQTGLWSPFSEKLFRTGPLGQIFPLELDDVADTPVPTLRDETGRLVALPTGTAVRLASADGRSLLGLDGTGSDAPTVTNPAPLVGHGPVKIRLAAESTELVLPVTRLGFTDDEGLDRTIYLPSVRIPAGSALAYWVAADGASYTASLNGTTPDFSGLAQGSPVPWVADQPGYAVEVVAGGFQLPVNIAFVPSPGSAPGDPQFYVTELYGAIKVVRNDGTVGTYASGLLNFDPTGFFPGTGEQGLSGIAIDAATGDLFVAMLYDGAPPNGPHYPKLVRFHSTDGGLTAATQTVLLDMRGESQGQSHFVSNVTFGPDGKLYVHMGDGFDATRALNLSSFRGKILRLNPDGSAPTDNPFYDAADGISARDYVFAYGFRNPFGGAWRAADGFHYEVENGPDANDRFAKVVGGASYGWNGTAGSLTTRALYNWPTPVAPVNIAFVQPETFGGSGFPSDVQGHAFVTESGATWATGPQSNGKRITEFVLDGAGNRVSGPTSLIHYTGSGKASVSALAAGPGGLYFSDLYKDVGYNSPIDPGARVLRIRFVGTAAFSADTRFAAAPATVRFTDQSNVPDPTAWAWEFGDGATSTERNPQHTYTANGRYTVRLTVTGSGGVAISQRNNFVTVGAASGGLQGEYFSTIDLTGPSVTRLDPEINFDWGNGAPMAGIPADNFSVRWTGQVEAPRTETVTFIATADDGIRLWVDDQKIIDGWRDQAPTTYRASMPLVAGRHYGIRLEYYEHTLGAVAQLGWSSPTMPEAIIPATYLFHNPPSPSAASDTPGQPTTFALRPASPNPFNPTTEIRYQLSAVGNVRLEVFDALGRRVRTLVDARQMAGQHTATFDASDLPSGVYLVRLTAGGLRQTQRITLLR